MKLIDKINNHTELSKFGVTAKLKASDYIAATANMEKFRLNVCDAGDSVALQQVQSQYPALNVVRVARTGNTSTYEVCVVSTEGNDTPAAFTQSASVSMAVCGSCSSLTGSVDAPAQDWYLIERPLAGTESLIDDAAKLAYAQTVAATYFGKSFNSTNDINATTETITKTAHGFSIGQAVVFSGTAPTGLTNGITYYIITAGFTVNAFRVALTREGSAVNLTAAVGTGVVTPAPVQFLANTGATALIKVPVPYGTTVTALLADVVTFSHTQEAMCEFTAPSSIAWVAAGTGIRSTRTMKISGIVRPDCNANGDRIADITDIVSGVKGVYGTPIKIAGTACADDYTVTQYSDDCLEEGCLTSNVTFTYAELPAFEGRSWELVPVSNVAGEGAKYGIVVTAGYLDIQFGNCSFDPTDYYEVMPVKMEISLLTEDGTACDFSTLPTITQTRYGQISRASGEYVIREATSKLDAYQKDNDQFSLNPRMREAFDMNILQQVERSAFYNLYYVTYYASYGKTNRKGEQEKFTTIFAVKETDPIAATLESQILSVLTAKSADKVTLRVID
jgi:hypothetical protein